MSKENDQKVPPLPIGKIIKIRENLDLFNLKLKEHNVQNRQNLETQEQKSPLNLKELKNNIMDEALTQVLNLYKIEPITKNLPQFDGNRNEVFFFIESVDKTLINCAGLKEFPLYTQIISNIRNKIIGVASQSLITHNIPSDNWAKIKTHLTSQYADTRDEHNLQFELYSLIKLNLEPDQLFEKIKTLLTLLSNYVKLHNDNQAIVEHQTIHYQNVGLTIFQAGIREPLGGRLRASKPTSLQEAMDFVIKEQNIAKLKFSSNSNSNSKVTPNYTRNFNQNYKVNPKPNTSQPTINNTKPGYFQQTNRNIPLNNPSTSTNIVNKSGYIPPNHPYVKKEIKQEKNNYNIETLVNDDEDFQEQASEI